MSQMSHSLLGSLVLVQPYPIAARGSYLEVENESENFTLFGKSLQGYNFEGWIFFQNFHFENAFL